MELYLRHDTLARLNWPALTEKTGREEVPRGTNHPIPIRFVNVAAKQIVDPYSTTTPTILFQVREAAGDTVLVESTTFTKTGTGSAAVFTIQPSFDTNELDAVLGVGTTELTEADLLAQVKITLSSDVSSTLNFPIRVQNDIARSGGASPVDADTLATQAEAEAGVNNAKWMSPLRTKQAIAYGGTIDGQHKYGDAVNPVSSFPNVKVLGAEEITEHAKYFALDGSTIEMPSSGTNGHASFACTVYIKGTNSFDHHHAFQDMTRLDTTGGTLTRYASYYSAPIIGSSAVVSDIAGFRALTPSLNGSTGTYYGFYTDGIAGVGAASYAFYSAGAAPSQLGGPLTAPLINASRASGDGIPYFTAKYSNLTGQWSWGMDVGGNAGDKQFTLRYYNGAAWQNAGMWIDVAEVDRLNIHKLRAASLPTYANDSAASSLTAGDVYKTATGELRIKL